MDGPPALGPGDLPAVFQCLKGALSSDPSVQKQAEAALLALGPRPNFCSCLTEIILSREADHSARWLAAVHLKNSVNKYWRPRLPGSVSEEEKGRLRRRLVELIDQEDSQIAVQLAVVLAKAARLDYPRAWPSLFTDLLGRLQAAGAGGTPGGTLTVRRVYLALHHVLKELASKRLASDQRTFEQVTSQLLEPLWSQWSADTQALAAGLPAALAEGAGAAASPSQQALLLTLERWLLQLKSLRRMLLFGFPPDSRGMQRVEAVCQLAPVMLGTLRSFLGMQQAAPVARSQLASMLDRSTLKLLKTLRQVQEVHPWSLLHSGALLPCLELCCEQIVSSGGGRGGRVAEHFLRQSLLMANAAVRCPAYRGSPMALAVVAGQGRSQLERLKAMAAEAAPALRAFWESRQAALVEAVVCRLFLLTPAELEEWEESAEEFHLNSERSAWEESVRGCAEQLFAALLEADRGALAPLVVALLQRAEATCPPGAASGLAAAPAAAAASSGGGRARGATSLAAPPPAVLAKEAVYRAVAVGAYELHDYVPLSPWLHSSLITEMLDEAPAARPLRRAAIRLVSHWAPKLARDDRPAVYRCLVAALGDGDAAVRLGAAAALRALVEDWEFCEEQFEGFVGPCFQLLAGALQHGAASYEAQLEVFALLNAVVDRLGEGVRPYAGGLLALLPGVWAGSEGQSLLRMQVLLALARLVNALGPDSPAAYPVVLPVLRLCTDPAQPDELNLLEDGLHLWLVALRNAPAHDPGLLAPFPHLLDVMRRSTEHVALGMRIAASCVLLGGAHLLQAHGQGLAAVLAGYIGNVKERGMLALLPVMALVVQAFPEQGPALLAPALQALLADLLSGREPGLVVAPALGVFARLLLGNPPAFFALFRSAAPHIPLPPPPQGAGGPAAAALQPAGRLLLAFVDLWLDKFEAIGQPAARKLSALALCALLPPPPPQQLFDPAAPPPLLERLDLIVAHVTAAWCELEGAGSAAGGGDAPGLEFYVAAAAPRDDDIHAAVNSEEAGGEAARRRKLLESDPLPRLRLAAFCKAQVEAAAAAPPPHGASMHAALAALDPALAAQLRALLDSAKSGRG